MPTFVSFLGNGMRKNRLYNTLIFIVLWNLYTRVRVFIFINLILRTYIYLSLKSVGTYSVYFVENFRKILEDQPSDQTSRWSSETNNPPQFLTLELHAPAIVEFIKFGKFDRSHVCNLKRFEVFGSWTDTGFVKLYSGYFKLIFQCNDNVLYVSSGLRNDSTPETFLLRHRIKDKNFPCRFIKIGSHFIYYYVALHMCIL